MSAPAAGKGPLARLRGANGRIPSRTRWIIAGAIALIAIVTAIAGIFWAVVAVLGLAWLVFGLIALFTGRASFVRIRSRWTGALAVFVGLAALMMGSLGQAVVHELANTTQVSSTSDSAASLTTVSSSSPTPKATATTKPKTTAKPKATSTPTPTPVATEAEVQEATAIPYGAVTVNDDTIDVGGSAVTVSGGNGEKVTTYRVKYIDGVEVSRSVAREETTVQPTDEVTAIGTRVPAAAPVPANNGCDPNYADACVPIASDVDCAGGSGNGPAYVDGPVRIVGSDIYDLDRDGDGIACDA